jgi:hypothetical protein
MTRKSRRTLQQIVSYPRPFEILDKLQFSKGWDYKTNMEFYQKRDKALVAILYLLAVRVSEALRLTKSQFLEEKDRVLVRAIKLSKSRIKVCSKCGQRIKSEERQKHLKNEHGIELDNPDEYFISKPRRDEYRQEGWLPKVGKRSPLTELVLDYTQLLEKDEKLFKFGRKRAWQIVIALTGEPCHWLRAYGENYLYDEWGKDLLAVADYVKVDTRTLPKYIRRSYAKYKVA